MPGHDLNESLFSTYDFPKFRKKSWVEIEKNHFNRSHDRDIEGIFVQNYDYKKSVKMTLRILTKKYASESDDLI